MKKMFNCAFMSMENVSLICMEHQGDLDFNREKIQVSHKKKDKKRKKKNLCKIQEKD